MYLNKSLIYTETLNNASLSNIPAKLLIGRSVSGNYFKGRIDDITILGDTVSQDDVLKLYYGLSTSCLLYTSPSPRDLSTSRMPSSA